MYIKIFLCSFLMLLFDVGGDLSVFFIGILVLVSYEIVRLFVGFMVIFKVFNLWMIFIGLKVLLYIGVIFCLKEVNNFIIFFGYEMILS